MNESAGGFDLEAVAETLGYEPVIPTRHEAARAVESANARLRDSRQATEEVAEGVRHLEVLRNRERGARAAGADAEALRNTLHLIRARADLDAARRELAAYPPFMERLEGDEPERVAALQRRLGREAASALVEDALATVAVGLVERGVRRLVVAGGETSGAVVERLGVRSLRIGAEIDAGVPWTLAETSAGPVMLALKSGNFGGRDFFLTAFEALPG